MPTTRSLRLCLAALAPVLAFGLIFGACGGNGDQGGTATEGASADEYVGTLPDGEAVAISVRPQGRATAFVCDGRKTAEWFTGSLEDENAINLDSATGDTPFAAELEGDQVSGIVATGGLQAFTIKRSTNEAGLYRIAVLADGTVIGESEGGSRLEGHLDEEGDLVGRVTLPDGETVPYRTGGPSGGKPGLYRVIVLPDGKAVGAQQPSVKATANVIQSVPPPTTDFKITWPS